MDRAIVERAVRALTSLNMARGAEITPPRAGRDTATCGSPHCARCYEVAPGVRIHPPRCGEDYRAWLEHWEAKGKLQ